MIINFSVSAYNAVIYSATVHGHSSLTNTLSGNFLCLCWLPCVVHVSVFPESSRCCIYRRKTKEEPGPQRCYLTSPSLHTHTHRVTAAAAAKIHRQEVLTKQLDSLSSCFFSTGLWAETSVCLQRLRRWFTPGCFSGPFKKQWSQQDRVKLSGKVPTPNLV